MDRKLRKKMESLDDFYLVEAIRDRDKFGYDEATVRTARRILKKRGRTDAELEGIYSSEIEPQDEKTRESVQYLFISFNILGTYAIRFFLAASAVLLILFLLASGKDPDTGSIFLTLFLAGNAAFFIIPILCVSRVRKITGLLLDRYDNTPSRELLNRLDESNWLLLGWFLLLPGFIYSFLKTRKTLAIILREMQFME